MKTVNAELKDNDACSLLCTVQRRHQLNNETKYQLPDNSLPKKQER